MQSFFCRVVASIFVTLVCCLPSLGQSSSTSTLAGLVADPNGAVIQGAHVSVKNSATGLEFKVTTASNGTYTVPALGTGVYTVTVEAAGFKRVIVQDVKVDVGAPATANVTLEVGAATESVVVQGGGEVLQTQSATISTTISTKQIAELPLQSRNTIYFLTMLPGVSSAATASPRNSTINGLPSSAYSVTLDGLNTQDNFNKNGDGFFSYISPSVDAIQEVTLSTATPGAESGGQGAIQIKFATRQGTNEFHGSLYEYHRNTVLNSNYWFTNRDTTPYDVQTAKLCNGVQEAYDPEKCKAPRAANLFNQFGGRIGGPIRIPKLFNGRDKAFFFVNFEEFRQPNQVSRQRTIMNTDTQKGIFRYVVSGETRTVDLLDLARRNNQVSTVDPVVGKLLADIRSSSANTGGIVPQSNPNLDTFTFSNGSMGIRYLPTIRFDVNLTNKHRLENTYNYQSYVTTIDTLNSRDPQFPGFPNHGGQFSNRFADSLTLRSTLSSSVVNEARVGLNGGTVLFFPDVNASQFSGSVGNQAGFNLNISAFSSITTATNTTAPSRRNSPIWDFADNLNWTRGAHNLSFGGQFTQVNTWLYDQTLVPTITFGLASGDPAATVFTTANTGLSGTNLTDAQNLYAVLTGRVTAVTANAVLNEKTNKYEYLAPQVRRFRMREWGFYGQDSWRVRQNLTLTGGLRYEFQLPFQTLNDVYNITSVNDLYGASGAGNLFKPGATGGSATRFTQYKNGDKAYNTDKNNFAPSVGFAWTVGKTDGWLKRLVGEGGQTVIRGGYSIAFERQGGASFSGVFDANPGLTLSATRSTTIGNLVKTGEALPVLLSQPSRLGPADFSTDRASALVAGSAAVAITSSANIFDPNLQVPYAQSWTLGVQRELSKNMAIEVRYVHTLNLQQWVTYNLNETNIVENGFLDEFKKAQANLQANIANGRGANFRYFGPGTGTSPLPIYLGYFSGKVDPNVFTNYTSANFAAANFVNPLALTNPLPFLPASTSSTQGLLGSATFRQNALNAGLPANLFLVNPDLQGGANFTGNGGYSRYDGLQVDFRRRLSKGLLLESNYTFAKSFNGLRNSFRVPRVNALFTTNGGTLAQAFKANWVYELPIGKGKWLFGNAGRGLDRLVGGWEWNGTARLQTGANLDLGNVNLVGMTRKDLQKAYKLRFDDANKRVYIFPQDIVDNTIRAFSVSATTASGYPLDSAGQPLAPTGRYIAPANGKNCIQAVTGQCGFTNLIIQGPNFARYDLSVIKRVSITERTNFEFRAEFLNAFNNINFLGNTNVAPSNTASNANFGQVTSAYRDVNNTQDPGGRLVQFVGRFNF
ncbi:MAG: TonB-dependent receptor [Acidobacteria bacterium]|nr:TonB-dependent receptor [Acidobacteriota bacterium]MBI3421947.1 TonB-dependent receptor [Acidobacteriota bacterium]